MSTLSSHPEPARPASRLRLTPAVAGEVARPLIIGTDQAVSELCAQMIALSDLPQPTGLGESELPRLAQTLAEMKPDGAILTCEPDETHRFAEAVRLLVQHAVPVATTAPLRSLLPFAPARHGTADGSRVYVAPGSAWSSARIDLASLINREPRPIDRAAVSGLLKGRRVLITGAGGSIGSELARIAASFEPSCIALMERSENALFEIDRQLGSSFRSVPRRAVLHDVVDAERTLKLVRELRPDVVFHAAAHKHVPLMEDHPAHAVTNNFFGTKSIADASLAAGAERFVLISSDKAVNPTSVMGATKRLAEIYVQALHRDSRATPASTPRTRFSMVRFGNVLGSSCSVVPIWSAQLVDGGPLTVTDTRMTRYFMTIHEAAGLVIQAASIDDPSPTAPVYVLDMGDPIRILDLARRFLDAHGYAARLVDRDGNLVLDPDAPDETGRIAQRIDILISGIRPGEKLHEELAYAAENLRPTPYEGIDAWAGTPCTNSIPSLVADLSHARHAESPDAVISTIRRLVPEMNRT
ncbi:MAG: polysaccharide biosynthesis protein [Phycisphaeraceae bacterium]|nr:polysaccharide biosynthesis protein [Phycisphaeraceae bacterium]